jgi:histidinol dehydrogenase
MIEAVYPKRKDWPEMLKRPVKELKSIKKIVKPILKKVERKGDKALRKFVLEYDHVELEDILVSRKEIYEAEAQVPADLRAAIEKAKRNIEKFHQAQLEQVLKVEVMPGVVCSRKSIPISKVGLYIPGGTAPLFSTVLMLGIPANIAKCEQLVMCTPPDIKGRINPAILYTANLVGIDKIAKVGGAQAIAAMAYGTESIPRVYKIFGPGNQYVTAAKQIVSQQGTAIDMPAGPSEVAIYADNSCQPAFVAADLLAQAEHGIDSQVLLVTTHEQVLREVKKEVKKQLEALPRKEIAAKALENSLLILVHNQSEAVDLLNEYAAEHLILSVNNAEMVADQIINAGSVFLGNFTPESAGDYASGTNHVLPTNGFARSFSGVSVDSFMKKITYQSITPEGLNNLGPAIERMAEAEHLDGHKNAVTLRLKQIQKNV